MLSPYRRLPAKREGRCSRRKQGAAAQTRGRGPARCLGPPPLHRGHCRQKLMWNLILKREGISWERPGYAGEKSLQPLKRRGTQGMEDPQNHPSGSGGAVKEGEDLTCPQRTSRQAGAGS